MSKKYEIVKITCPKCKKTKEVGILKEHIKEIGTTILSVPYVVCDHSFLVFIDSKFKVRGYQKDDCSVMENQKEFIRIKIECPECNKTRLIHLEKISLNNSGITTINIPPKFVCKHSIRVFIDRNFQIRDVFISDGVLSKKNIFKTTEEKFRGLF